MPWAGDAPPLPERRAAGCPNRARSRRTEPAPSPPRAESWRAFATASKGARRDGRLSRRAGSSQGASAPPPSAARHLATITQGSCVGEKPVSRARVTTIDVPRHHASSFTEPCDCRHWALEPEPGCGCSHNRRGAPSHSAMQARKIRGPFQNASKGAWRATCPCTQVDCAGG